MECSSANFYAVRSKLRKRAGETAVAVVNYQSDDNEGLPQTLRGLPVVVEDAPPRPSVIGILDKVQELADDVGGLEELRRLVEKLQILKD